MGLNPVPELETYLNSNSSKVNLVNNPYDIHSLYLAEKFKAGAFQKSILTACVSSTQAIALGYESILNKEAKVVIAGGTDSLVNLVPLTSFGKLGVIPETATGTECTPFDRNRNGTLAGEAAGFVILASEEFINQNNIQPLGQIMGYGNSLDGYKITAPDPSGISMTKAIENALSNSGLKSSQIDYINAHGTGTRHNDELELRCIGKALGEDAKRIPISSTKDRHGHAIAAAGIQELCLLLELMKDIPVYNLYSYKCDLLNYDEIVKTVGAIYKKFSKVNSLVNCAGYTKEYPFAMLDEDEISHTLDINLKSPMMLTHAILRIMFRQKKGSIINVSSISAVKKGRGIVAYASAKSGIENFTRTLASEVGKKNIRVNCIRPGIIETSMSGQVMSRTKDRIFKATYE